MTHIKKFLIASSLLILFFCVSAFLLCSYLIPLPEKIATKNNGSTKIYDKNGILLYEILLEESGKKRQIKIEDVSEILKNAFLAAEDKDFYSHRGINIKGVLRAFRQNWQAGEIVSGGSSITQQLVKNILGTELDRSWKNKLMESAYALRVEAEFEKDEIFSMYLNNIYFGNLAYGIDSAALTYFGKRPNQLDLAESALLAGLPKAPSFYNPFTNLDGAKKRQKYVLDQMVKENLVSQEDAEIAYEEDLKFKLVRHEIKAPHFVRFVINELEKKYGNKIHQSGWNIYTTVDSYKQKYLEDIVKENINKLEEKNVSNGALIAIDLENDEILAYVGSKDFFDEEIHGEVDIIQSLRQPGSALKPFTYLLSLIKGKTLASIYEDVEVQFSTPEGPYTPKNYDLQYHGPVTMRRALANSYNIPAILALDDIGVGSLINFLNKFGIKTLNAGAQHYGLSLTLGGGEVKMFELADAYKILAKGGEKSPLVYTKKILDSQNNVIYENKKEEAINILGEKGKLQSYLIKSVMSDNESRVEAFGFNNLLEIGRPAAVKTGTTRNFKDNWTFGFTPQILVATWAGNADASSMYNVSGIDGAGPIWNEAMVYLHKNLPVKEFTKPQGLVEREICVYSGLLATNECPKLLREIFIKGSEPQKKDDTFEKIKVTRENETQLWSIWKPECQLEYTEKVFSNFPPKLKQWAQENGYEEKPRKTCLGNKNNENLALKKEATGNDAHIFAISNPYNGDSYTLDETIPDKDEKILIKINYSEIPEKTCYVIDNNEVGCASESPFEIKWTPSRGAHSVFANVHLDSEKIVKTEKVEFEVK